MAITQEEAVKRRLRAVPDGPGVYLFRDQRAQVIYVGKALRLRDRLRSYFTPGYGETARVSELVRSVKVLPSSFKIAPAVEGRMVSFALPVPRHVTVEVNAKSPR